MEGAIRKFTEVVDSYAVHRELSRRNKLPDETYQAYMYKILEIAAQTNVDMRSIFNILSRVYLTILQLSRQYHTEKIL